MNRLPTNWRKMIGNRLSVLRVSRQLSRQKLAGMIGIDYQHLGKYERGEVSKPNVEVFLLAALALEVPASALLNSLVGQEASLKTITQMIVDQLPPDEQNIAARIIKVLSDIEN